MGRCRRFAGAVALLALLAPLAACGSSGSSSAVPTYPAPSGQLVDRSLATSLGTVLRPPGVPDWATPPVRAAAARIAITSGNRQAVVVPFRSGPGWCIGLLAGGRPSIDWCTKANGARQPVEGGLTLLSLGQVELLARVSSSVAKLVVTRADGRRIAVALHHGVALAPLGRFAHAGERPVSVMAIGRDGTTLARRNLGWTAAEWSAQSPRGRRVTMQQFKAAIAVLRTPAAPCIGAPVSSSGTFVTEISSDRPSAFVSDFLPDTFSAIAGKLYVSASRPLRMTLIDQDGTRRPVALGAGRCAYIALSSHERRAPFRLEARTTAGAVVQVTRPDSWPGFPTDEP